MTESVAAWMTVLGRIEQSFAGLLGLLHCQKF